MDSKYEMTSSQHVYKCNNDAAINNLQIINILTIDTQTDVNAPNTFRLNKHLNASGNISTTEIHNLSDKTTIE